ncbi:hypothetical protein [Flavivirga eckloniae]|uniref:Uncharacterized protein n=1 Tax=Flavivirga eckloniae TaxID=1803846 RepID=A0A2K9PNW1_9FLAO|nr:hypothetical protein [Flavivirga eckloniae]AUP78498.1 hypothetical protein C1H87_07150 [Flavivirga eckloniae]
MKKIIGVIGVTMMVAAMFFSTNTSIGDDPINLSNLLAMSEANAEGCNTVPGSNNGDCNVTVSGGHACIDDWWWSNPCKG